MTASQKLVLAVADAVGDDLGTRLTETEMALICWKRFPADFGIITDTQWPDTKRFSTVLHGDRSEELKRRIKRVSRGRYSLTVTGIEEARLLRMANPTAIDTEKKFDFDSSYFVRIVELFRISGNKPRTARSIMKSVGVSRGSLSQMLYRDHKDSFVASTALGYKRKKVWRLQEHMMRVKHDPSDN